MTKPTKLFLYIAVSTINLNSILADENSLNRLEQTVNELKCGVEVRLNQLTTEDGKHI